MKTLCNVRHVYTRCLDCLNAANLKFYRQLFLRITHVRFLLASGRPRLSGQSTTSIQQDYRAATVTSVWLAATHTKQPATDRTAVTAHNSMYVDAGPERIRTRKLKRDLHVTDFSRMQPTNLYFTRATMSTVLKSPACISPPTLRVRCAIHDSVAE
jgi:hypothetical protein